MSNPTRQSTEFRDEEVFFEALGIIPAIGPRYMRPYGPDTNPTCFFKNKQGYLRWYDNGKGIIGWNSWDMLSYRLFGERVPLMGSNDYQNPGPREQRMMELLKHMNGGNNSVVIPHVQNVEFDINLRTYHTKTVLKRESDWFGRFGITPAQMIEDEVYTCFRNTFTSNNGNSHDHLRGSNVCVTMERGAKSKVYRPELKRGDKNGWMKWCASWNQDCYHYWRRNSDVCLWFGAWKDGRVAYNNSVHSVVAAHSESTFPSPEIVEKIKAKHKFNIYVGDCDSAGLDLGEKISKKHGLIHSPIPKKAVHWAEIRGKKLTDISEYYEISKDKSNTIRVIERIVELARGSYSAATPR